MITLATEYTTKGNYFYEYFKTSNVPVTESPIWSAPYKVVDLTGYINEDGNPVLSFTPLQAYMIYTLVRQQDTEETSSAEVIKTFAGITDMMYFTDTEADGAEYKYFIAAYNPNVILENGTYLYGEYSDYVELNVAAKIPSEAEQEQEASQTPEPSVTPSPETSSSAVPDASPTPTEETAG